MATGTELKIGDLRSYKDGDTRSRVNKIREKIESGSPFEMLDLNNTILDETKILQFKNKDIKSFFEKDNDENINLIGGYTKKSLTLFKSKSGNEEFLLKQLYKSPTEFGGGKGSGGGAADTAVNESLQCFYASILFNTDAETLTVEKGKNNCTQKVVKAQAKYCHTQASASGTKYTSTNFVEQLWKKAPKDWIEVDYTLNPPTNVYMRIAQKLYDSPQAAPLLKGGNKVHFHRGSPFMSAIYVARKRAWDKQKTLAPKDTAVRAPASGFQNDKWNPGDIWVSNLDPIPTNSNPLCFTDDDKSRCLDWRSLKDHVLMDAKGKRGKDHTPGAILGVSLKKVGANPKVLEFNAGEVKDDGTVTHDRVQNTKVTYEGFVFGQTGNFFSSADCYLHFGGDSKSVMQLRSTATTTSWQGEIKGGKAGGGKIGGGGINYFCESILKKSITSGQAIKGADAWNEFRGKPSVEAIYKLYKKYNKEQMGTFGDVTFKPTKKGDEDINESKITPIVKISKVKAKTNNPYTQLSNDFMPVDTSPGRASGHYAYVINTENSTNDTARLGYVSKEDFKILADNYTSKGHNSSAAFYFSKYMCLLLLDAMDSSNEWDIKVDGGRLGKHQFATKVVRYAMSNINVSTYFIKIV